MTLLDWLLTLAIDAGIVVWRPRFAGGTKTAQRLAARGPRPAVVVWLW